MTFVKPSHGDDPEVHSSKQIKWSSFDHHQPEHRVLDEHSVEKLLGDVLESVTNTGLQQFWQTNSLNSTSINFEALWCYVIFSHAYTSTISQEKRFDLKSLVQCYDHLHSMKILPKKVSKIEEATRR